ncbi:PREDICTED: zinc finger and BTB domain-containing protein 44-like [Branchiostoma belcheri]|uniref:Zinc finger and BTB domain-containing protein 44-like n=1 Tax=Branchiostoma belcheri TaxID=7741 RepID=A0A6P4YC54_BRABE|nr:PREDICTED: zinc finger and BTB domain-containing protein 44-like [Branchiostoma belcheri]XP_019616368.1 PREDICTED: zinc finger and BTB domain-containing protein 44-like [Branchiostoma belcheri]
MSSVHLHTVSEHASLLLINLNSMRKKHHLCDVVLRIQDKHFPAHKAVLAGCSQWFYSKFVDQLSPRLTLTSPAQPTIVSLNELTLKGFEPILEFAYTSRIRLTSSNVFDILSAASYLQMHKLMADCTSFMRSNVEVKFREPAGGNGRGSEAEVTSNFSPPHAGSPLLNAYETPGTVSEESMGGERNDNSSRVSPNGNLNVSETSKAQNNEDRASSNNSRPHSNQSAADKQSILQSPGESTAAQEQTVTVKKEQTDENQPTCAQAATSQQNSVSNSGIMSGESSELEHHFGDGESPEHDLHKSDGSDPNFLGSVVYPVSLHTVRNLWPDQSETGAAGDAGTENTATQDTGTEAHDVMDQMATLQQQARNSFLEFQDKEESMFSSSPYFPQGLETGESSNLRHLLTNQEASSSGPSMIRDILTAQAANVTSMGAGPSVGRDAWFHSPEMVASMGLEGVMSTMSSPMTSRMMAPNPNKTLHPFREKKVTCSICKSQFNMIGHLKQHLLQVHSHCPKLYLCDTCGAQFDDVLKLSNHMVTHKGRFSCQFCGKRCSQLSSLYAHERTHTGERPYHCQSCGKSFRNKSHLNRHRLIHTGVKSYQCNLCMKKFTRREGLKLHMPKHAEEHPYLCHICLKAFSQQDQFSRHKAQHNTRGLRMDM